MLTLNSVKEFARKAYEEGRLLAQQHDFSGDYFYRKEIDGKVIGCAIGVALTPEQGKILDERDLNSYSIRIPVVSAIIHVAKNEQADLRSIQSAHDEWANPNLPLTIRESAHKTFRTLIGLGA